MLFPTVVNRGQNKNRAVSLSNIDHRRSMLSTLVSEYQKVWECMLRSTLDMGEYDEKRNEIQKLG